MTQIEYHPAANLFPMMEWDNLQALVKDIRKNGLLEDIELLEGKILDGRNRYQACLLAKVEPRFATVTPRDPVAYVLSKNLVRRQLSFGQRSMIAARAKEYYAKQAKERQRQHGGTRPGRAADTSRKSARTDFGKSTDAAGRARGFPVAPSSMQASYCRRERRPWSKPLSKAASR